MTFCDISASPTCMVLCQFHALMKFKDHSGITAQQFFSAFFFVYCFKETTLSNIQISMEFLWLWMYLNGQSLRGIRLKGRKHQQQIGMCLNIGIQHCPIFPVLFSRLKHLSHCTFSTYCVCYESTPYPVVL